MLNLVPSEPKTFKRIFPIYLKRRVSNKCVMRALIYGAETLTRPRTLNEELRGTHHKMGRSLLGITIRD